jgi:predicted peptidase
MNVLLLVVLIVLLILIIMPFWLSAPKTSKDRRYVKGVLGPNHGRYTLSIPEDYTGNQPVPLVVALHYGGHGIPFYGELILRELIEPALRELGAIILAPDCPTEDWSQPESDQFILDLLSHVGDQYNLDPRKTLITGYSLGGIGTWHLAGQFPDRFATALVMAAQPPENTSVTNWTVPLYVIHGRDDELFPIVNTTKVIVQLENNDVDIAYRILERVSHFETQKFFTPLQDAVPWVLNHWDPRK